MYYSFRGNKSFEELKEEANKVRPYKVLKKEGYYNGSWQRGETEGYSLGRVHDFVKDIENHQKLTSGEKRQLEEIISDNITRQPYSTYRINRGALNVLFLIENGVVGAVNFKKLASVQALKKHGLIYSTYEEAKKTIEIEKIEGIMGSEKQIETEIVDVKVLKLTEYGKAISGRLVHQGKQVVNKDMRNLKRLGYL